MDLDKLKANGIKPYYEDRLVSIINGDCLKILPAMYGFSSVVTDPPYELGFMGKSWDSRGISFQKETWDIIRKSCLPGAPLMAFGGARTQHRIACAIEDAGWEIRDCIIWMYGSGFPKSLCIGKAIDKMKGVNRTGIIKTDGKATNSGTSIYNMNNGKDTSMKRVYETGNPYTPEAKLWEGYHTSLKPAYEPIILAMNPLDGTFAENALKYGVAGLNIDGCRIETEERIKACGDKKRFQACKEQDGRIKQNKDKIVNTPYEHNKGRFPANFLHNGSQEVMELFPETSKGQSAARFFYCAKASRTERNMGCEGLEPKQYSYDGRNKPVDTPYQRNSSVANNSHPTVKPLALMEYLCKLVKMPEYNLILDPFMGSGTTLLACIKLGIPCVGIEQDEHYCEIAAKRCHKLISDIYSE